MPTQAQQLSVSVATCHARCASHAQVPEAVAEELRSALKEVEDRLAQRTAEVRSESQTTLCGYCHP
jgi:hypothetical protein